MKNIRTKLTPSELIYLHGDQFVDKALMGNTVLVNGEKVSTNKLAESIILAAVLGNRQENWATPEFREHKSMFGLLKSQKVHLIPKAGAESEPWPLSTWEGRLYHLAQSNSTLSIEQLVAQQWNGDVAYPWAEAVGWVADGLVKEGLLTPKGKSYGLPESTKTLIRAEDVSTIKEMFARAEKNDPELLKKIKKEINAGLSARTESSQDYDPD